MKLHLSVVAIAAAGLLAACDTGTNPPAGTDTGVPYEAPPAAAPPLTDGTMGDTSAMPPTDGATGTMGTTDMAPPP